MASAGVKPHRQDQACSNLEQSISREAVSGVISLRQREHPKTESEPSTHPKSKELQELNENSAEEWDKPCVWRS